MGMPIRKLQITRRLVQFLVVALILAIPAVSRYNHYLITNKLDIYLERWEGTIEGGVLRAVDTAVRLLPGTEVVQAGSNVRDEQRVLDYTQHIWGGPWSIEVFGISMTDPLVGAESILASRDLTRVMLISEI